MFSALFPNSKIITITADCALESNRIGISIFIFDAAGYVKTATSSFKVSSHRMFHITHSSYNCAKKIRAPYFNVNHVITHFKALEVKNKTIDIGQLPHFVGCKFIL